jgi:hypothetical protein
VCMCACVCVCACVFSFSFPPKLLTDKPTFLFAVWKPRVADFACLSESHAISFLDEQLLLLMLMSQILGWCLAVSKFSMF